MSDKQKDSPYVKIGNTSYHKGQVIKQFPTFSSFKSEYEGKLRGQDVEEIYKSLGGKIPTSKEK